MGMAVGRKSLHETTYQGETWILDSSEGVEQVRRGSNIQLLSFSLVTSPVTVADELRKHRFAQR
jgi:hypothetical protein